MGTEQGPTPALVLLYNSVCVLKILSRAHGAPSRTATAATARLHIALRKPRRSTVAGK